MSHSAAYPCRHQLANSSAARETLVLSAIATRAGLGLEKNRVLVCVCWGCRSMAGEHASSLPPWVLAWPGGATGVCPARHSPCEMPTRGFKNRQVRRGRKVGASG